MPLPPLPRIVLREVEDLSPPDDRGFLRLRRLRLRAEPSGGAPSEPFVYDSVEREALDAVVMAAHYDEDGSRWVYLRSAIRPPVALRPVEGRPLPEKEHLGVLWELPAGLVEPGETSPDGLARCAARELSEELGFEVKPAAFSALGPATIPTGGVIGERHHFFHVRVDPTERREPAEDGSVLERDALVEAVRLDEALELCRRGVIEDAKTELGIRRLAET